MNQFKFSFDDKLGLEKSKLAEKFAELKNFLLESEARNLKKETMRVAECRSVQNLMQMLKVERNKKGGVELFS